MRLEESCRDILIKYFHSKLDRLMRREKKRMRRREIERVSENIVATGLPFNLKKRMIGEGDGDGERGKRWRKGEEKGRQRSSERRRERKGRTEE